MILLALLTVWELFNSLKEYTIYEKIVKRGTFVGNTVKRVPVFDILSTLFRVCFAIFCSSIGTQLTWKPFPPPPPRSKGCSPTFPDFFMFNAGIE